MAVTERDNQANMTATKQLGVGIIGASAERGWAKDSHVPAVQKLAGLELAAVASGTPAKAASAAQAFGAKAGYAEAKDLIQDPNVDLVTVAVKVPDHRELVLAALAAGKHVYCEWPLGRNLAETEEMAQAADAAGVHVVIGLQTRMNPVAQRAAELIAGGAIGRVLNARIYSATMAFGPKVEAAMSFAEKAENGVTLPIIQGAHTVDFALAMLGPLVDLSALVSTQYPQIEIDNDSKRQARSTPDHLLVLSRLVGGAALTVEVAGGRPAEATPFHLEVTGTVGNLVLAGGAARGFQSGRLRLSVEGKAVSVDEGEATGLPDAAANVASAYAALRDDILRNTRTVPDFRHAVRLMRLVESVISSSETGMRKVLVLKRGREDG